MEDKQAYQGDLNNGHGKMDCINTKQKQVQMGSEFKTKQSDIQMPSELRTILNTKLFPMS